MRTELYLHNDDCVVTIDVEYDAFYQAARLYGEPEDCCPEDSGLDVTGYAVVAIDYADESTPRVTPEEVQEAALDAADRIVDECWDDYHMATKRLARGEEI